MLGNNEPDDKVRIAGVDPALRNFGIARMFLSPSAATPKPILDKLLLMQTEKDGDKSVRRNSDDLRRSKELFDFFQNATHDCAVVFSEIPHGSQSAASMKSMGICIGILAGCPVPVIQVQAHETKLATVGTRTASKQEMIEWGVETYPTANWITHKGKPTLANEHLADALAVVHAGIKTSQFQQLLGLWRFSSKKISTV